MPNENSLEEKIVIPVPHVAKQRAKITNHYNSADDAERSTVIGSEQISWKDLGNTLTSYS